MYRTISAKERSEAKVIDTSTIYKAFSREKRLYNPKDLLGKTKKVNPIKIEERLFRKIILTYLKFYFFDLYNTYNPIYFPLTGKIRKVAYSKWINKQRKGTSDKVQVSKAIQPIGLFWYLRPTDRFLYKAILHKVTGNTARLTKLDKEFVRNQNYDLLPIFITKYYECLKQKTLHYVFKDSIVPRASSSSKR